MQIKPRHPKRDINTEKNSTILGTTDSVVQNPDEDLKRKKKATYMLKTNESDSVRCSGIRTESKYRSEFMRDRDRVLYSKAFRRLSGKTQVYMSGLDDHNRTRLTHTLEVSQIARSIAEPLKLDMNLVEAIALGHDLGHTPYGHAGERTLHEIMTPNSSHILGPICPLNRDDVPEAFKPFLGFKHNLQGLVVAMELEKNYGELGLDLTNYTLYGIQSHSAHDYKMGRVHHHDSLGYYDSYLVRGCKDDKNTWAWSLESLLVSEADEIAQRHHDVEDALLGRLITREEVVTIIKECFGAFDPFKKLSTSEKRMLESPQAYDMGKFVSLISRIIVNLLVTRLTETAAYHINQLGAKYGLTNANFRDFRRNHDPDDGELSLVFSYSYTQAEHCSNNSFSSQIKKFANRIGQHVLSSYDIQKADAKGRYIIRKLFQAYYSTPQQLPDHCIYELLSTYYNLKEHKDLRLKTRNQFQQWSESDLRTRAKYEGIGSIRQIFSDMFVDRTQTMPAEELILMRVICNYIAGMTDTYAQKCYEELYG